MRFLGPNIIFLEAELLFYLLLIARFFYTKIVTF